MLLIATALLAVTGIAQAQEIHAPHCLHGCPAGSPATNDLIIREIYILSSNDETKFADWAAYKVTKASIGSTAERNWKPDPVLADNETLEPKDYKGAHARIKTDRGHQVPLASFTSTPHWRDTNYLSNITPQKSALNQGPWVKLETAVRGVAKHPDVEAAYVMTGPLYERADPGSLNLPKADENHIVPSGYWKIVAIQSGNEIDVAAFVFDQEAERRAEFCDEAFVSSVRGIESRSKLNFFHALDRNAQEAIETNPSTLRQKLGCEP